MEKFIEKYKIDPLKILNLDEDYDMKELKKSYKKLSLKYHPDKPNGSTKMFQLIYKAYKYLNSELEDRIDIETVREKIEQDLVLKENKLKKMNLTYNDSIEDVKYYTKDFRSDKKYEIKEIDYNQKYTDNITPEKLDIKDFNATFEYLKSKNNQLVKMSQNIVPMGISCDRGAPICSFNNDIMEDCEEKNEMNNLFWKYIPKKEDLNIDEIKKFKEKNKEKFKEKKYNESYKDNVSYGETTYNDKDFENRHYESMVKEMDRSKIKINNYKKQYRLE